MKSLPSAGNQRDRDDPNVVHYGTATSAAPDHKQRLDFEADAEEVDEEAAKLEQTLRQSAIARRNEAITDQIACCKIVFDGTAHLPTGT